MKTVNNKIKKWFLFGCMFLMDLAARAQLDTKSIADKAVSEVSNVKPLLQIFCTLGIIIAMIAGGFKFQSDNSDKGKVIGVTLGVVIFLGIALYAINQLNA